MSIEGELVSFEYRSPHAWVYVMAKDDKGQMKRFATEWSNPNRLARQGIMKDALKAGDYVIVYRKSRPEFWRVQAAPERH